MLARIANVKTDPDELMERAKTSGLVRYLFKDDLSGSLDKADFVKLQADLIDDVLEMEFTRYVKDTSEKISETDFCRHLLYSSAISQKSIYTFSKANSNSNRKNRKFETISKQCPRSQNNSIHSTVYLKSGEIPQKTFDKIFHSYTLV